MASAAVQHVIALASQLTDDEGRLVVDAIAPTESIAELAGLPALGDPYRERRAVLSPTP